MIHFTSLNLSNIVYYKEASFDLGYKGLTVIRGQNLNVSHGLKKSNGSGKSLLVSTIPNLLYSSSPIVWQNKARAKKDIYCKGSSIKLGVTIGDSSYELSKGQSGSSLKYSLLKDGKDLQPRTATIAEEMLQEIVPINEEQFWSLVYLDSRRPFVLHTGTVAQRMSFFSELFELHQFDKIKEHFQHLIRELTAEQNAFSKREEDRNSLKTQLTNIDIDVLKGKCDGYKTELKQLVKQQSLWHKKVSDLRLLLSHQTDSLSKLVELTTAYLGSTAKHSTIYKMDVSELMDLVAVLYSEIQREEKHITKHKDWERWRKEYLTHEKQAALINEQLNKLDKPPNNWEQLVDRNRQKRYAIKSRLAEIDRDYQSLSLGLKGLVREKRVYEHELTLIKDICVTQNLDLDKLGVQKVHQKVSSTIGSLENQVQELDQSLQMLRTHIEHSTENSCTLCGQSLSNSQAKVLRTKLEQRKGQCVESLTQFRNLSLAFNRLPHKPDDYLEQKRELGDLRTHRKELVREQKRLDVEEKENFDGWFLYQSKQNEIKRLNLPEETGSKLHNYEDTLRDVEKWRWMVQHLEPMVHTIPKMAVLGKEYGTTNYKKLMALKQTFESQIEQNKERLEILQERVPKLQVTIDRYQQSTKRLQALDMEADQLGDKLRDMPIYKALVDAYSPKGLKSSVIQQLALTVQQNMNTYSRHLFHEPTEFEFIIEPNKFDVLFHRTEGNKVVTADVRSLSGAEGRAFNLLLLMGVLPLVPSNKRTNILILDEMSANMDKCGRDLLIQEFLPLLNNMIPHIIIVTPTNEEYPEAREFIAQKKGNKMRLIPA